MTWDQFSFLYAATQKSHPNFAADTLRRINNQVFAEVADLEPSTPATDQAAADALARALEEA